MLILIYNFSSSFLVKLFTRFYMRNIYCGISLLGKSLQFKLGGD